MQTNLSPSNAWNIPRLSVEKNKKGKKKPGKLRKNLVSCEPPWFRENNKNGKKTGQLRKKLVSCEPPWLREQKQKRQKPGKLRTTAHRISSKNSKHLALGSTPPGRTWPWKNVKRCLRKRSKYWCIIIIGIVVTIAKMIWHEMVSHGMIWHDMEWYGMIWHDMAWYGML